MKRQMKFIFLQVLFCTTLFSQSEEFGLASYYSDLFHGKPTASGELYDMNKLTTAHKTHSFGTILKVTRLDNNKSVQVRVNDRGPFISGRVVEVSKEAAKRLDLIRDGSASVKVEIVSQGSDEKTIASNKPADKPKQYENTEPVIKKESAPITEAPAKPAPEPVKEEKKVTKKSKPEKVIAKPGPAKVNQGKAVLVKGSDYQTFDLYQIELKRPEKKGFGVQVAAFTSQDALFKKIADLQGDWFSDILVSIEKGKKDEVLYKLILGPFPDEPSAQSYKTNLKKKKKLDGFVVNLASL